MLFGEADHSFEQRLANLNIIDGYPQYKVFEARPAILRAPARSSKHGQSIGLFDHNLPTAIAIGPLFLCADSIQPSGGKPFEPFSTGQQRRDFFAEASGRKLLTASADPTELVWVNNFTLHQGVQ